MQSCGLKGRPCHEAARNWPCSPLPAPVLPFLCLGLSLTTFGVLRQEPEQAENSSVYFTGLFFAQVCEPVWV